MSQKLIVSAALNSLSLGNVSYNILKELYNRKVHVIFFPIQIDLGAYNVQPEFKVWLESSINNRYTKFKKDIPTLRIWHLNGSESKYSNNQYLFSFHETDSPTPAEVNIANQQEHVFFSSNWTVENFQRYEAENVSFVPLGFDPDLNILPDRQVNKNITHWILGPSKFEKRKLTQKIIELWIKKYGNNQSHQLSVAVTNPFLNKQQNGFDTHDLLNSVWKGLRPSNINELPYMKTNLEVNKLLNAADINLSGISAAEGWNLPAFNSAALGKTVIVTNVTAHKDWATPENAILIEPNSIQPSEDGMFFRKGDIFNQGNFYTFSDESIIEGFEKAEKICKNVNVKGLELQKTFTYKNTVDLILNKVI